MRHRSTTRWRREVRAISGVIGRWRGARDRLASRRRPDRIDRSTRVLHRPRLRALPRRTRPKCGTRWRGRAVIVSSTSHCTWGRRGRHHHAREPRAPAAAPRAAGPTPWCHLAAWDDRDAGRSTSASGTTARDQPFLRRQAAPGADVAACARRSRGGWAARTAPLLSSRESSISSRARCARAFAGLHILAGCAVVVLVGMADTLAAGVAERTGAGSDPRARCDAGTCGGWSCSRACCWVCRSRLALPRDSPWGSLGRRDVPLPARLDAGAPHSVLAGGTGR